MKARITLFALVVLTLTLLSLNAGAQNLTYKFSDVVVPGAIETDTYAINDANKITGDYIDASGIVHGMTKKGTNVVTFDDPNGNTTQGFGINNKGVVVGWYINNNGSIVGFKWAGGKFVDINFPNSIETEATGINDNGVIVGLYVDANGVQHGFKKKGTTYKTLDLKNMVATTAWGINNDNTITIYGNDSSGNYHSFALNYKGQTKVPIEVPGDGTLGTVIHTPNNDGDICMTWFDSNNGGHGAVLTIADGVYNTFDDPKASNSTRADGLNIKLVVDGRYSPAGGGNFGFKAVPQ